MTSPSVSRSSRPVVVLFVSGPRAGRPGGDRRRARRCGRRACCTLEQALAGFGDPTVLFIASLFVVSEALDATGVTTWAGQQLRRPGGGRTARAWSVLTMLIVAGLTALISVNGAVAALLPVVVVHRRAHRSRAVAAADAARVRRARGVDAGAHRHAGERDRVDVRASTPAARASGSSSSRSPASRCCSASIAVVAAARPAPAPGTRDPVSCPPTSAAHAQTLVEQYGLQDSAVARDVARPRRRRRGRSPTHIDVAAALIGRSSGLAEVIIPPRSPLIGDARVPGHDHRRRRPGGARRSSAAARSSVRATSSSRPATRSCSRAPGTRSTATPRDAARARGGLARAGPPPGGRHWAGRRARDRGPGRDDRAARDRRRAGGRRGAGRGGRAWCCCGCVSLRGRLPRRSRGRRSCSSPG